MDLLNNKSTQQIAQSLIGEVAKANNEITCAVNDISKAKSRLSFCIAALNEINRREINGSEETSNKTNTTKSNS